MTETEFLQRAEEALGAIERAVDATGMDIESSRAGNVLTLELADGSRVVLCVGDSHTRGRPDPDNYPAALEQILNARTGERWRVINLGVPGQNTGQVRLRFERYLAYYRPTVVLHWGGINNGWNQAERDGSRGFLATLVEHSRLIRFLRVALFYRGLERRVLADTHGPVPELRGPPAP